MSLIEEELKKMLDDNDDLRDVNRKVNPLPVKMSPSVLKIRQHPEQDLQNKIIKLAKVYGYEQIYHTWRSDHSPAGFPDLILLREKRMVVAEIKSEKGILSPEQYFWLCAFRKITKDVYLWKPSDWQELTEVLK